MPANMTSAYLVNLLLLLCYQPNQLLAETECGFVKSESKTLYGHNDHVLYDSELEDCKAACLGNSYVWCSSFDYVAKSKTCYLANATAVTHPQDFGSHHYADYYELSCDIEVTTAEPTQLPVGPEAGGDYWFHPRCGPQAEISNGQKTAKRKDPETDWKHATVLTNQTLESDVMFEVRLDEKSTGWAGAIYIGVTTHSPSAIRFPDFILDLKSGIWLFNGRAVCINGDCVGYGNENIESLEVGEKVGVKRAGDGSLHCYVNGVDQGVAATDIPADVYGIIDIYGQTVQITIVEPSV